MVICLERGVNDLHILILAKSGRPGIWLDLRNSVLTAPLTPSSGRSVCRYYTVTIKATRQQHAIMDDHFHIVLS